ncbi:hypothetical protein M9458_045568, partial [Cirrhinus mrigala]
LDVGPVGPAGHALCRLRLPVGSSTRAAIVKSAKRVKRGERGLTFDAFKVSGGCASRRSTNQ